MPLVFFFFLSFVFLNWSYSYQPTPQPEQCRILNPLSEARNQTCVLMVTSWIHFGWATTGTPLCGLLGLMFTDPVPGRTVRTVLIPFFSQFPGAPHSFSDWLLGVLLVGIGSQCPLMVRENEGRTYLSVMCYFLCKAGVFPPVITEQGVEAPWVVWTFSRSHGQ